MEEKKEMIEHPTLSESLSIDMKTLFSISHIQSAALFARNAHKIETAYDGKFSEEVSSSHRAYVVGTIFSTVAFLESQINELFTGIDDEHRKNQFSDDQKKRFRLVWELVGSKTLYTPTKYDLALKCIEKEPHDSNSQRMKDLKCIIEIRNELVHYKPRWVRVLDNNIQTTNTHRLENQLKGRFKTNPITGEGNPFFPDKCLGYGFADWTVRTGIEFSDAFFCQIGLPIPYEHIRKRLVTIG